MDLVKDLFTLGYEKSFYHFFQLRNHSNNIASGYDAAFLGFPFMFNIFLSVIYQMHVLVIVEFFYLSLVLSGTGLLISLIVLCLCLTSFAFFLY